MVHLFGLRAWKILCPHQHNPNYDCLWRSEVKWNETFLHIWPRKYVSVSALIATLCSTRHIYTHDRHFNDWTYGVLFHGSDRETLLLMQVPFALVCTVWLISVNFSHSRVALKIQCDSMWAKRPTSINRLWARLLRQWAFPESRAFIVYSLGSLLIFNSSKMCFIRAFGSNTHTFLVT